MSTETTLPTVGSSGTGRVLNWDRAAGFGFCSVTGRAENLFVHHSDLVADDGRVLGAGRRELRVGDHVAFIIGLDPSGRPCATRVSLLDAPAVAHKWHADLTTRNTAKDTAK